MVAWSFAVPIFECPDEPDHWKYAQYLRENHSPPPFSAAFIEGSHPPLYYLFIAPLASECPVPRSTYTYSSDDIRVSTSSPRFFQNAPADFERYWPIRAARMVTVLISLCTVLLCYLAGREASGSPATGFLVAGLVAFLPEFSFRGMNVSNDALLTAFCALATYLMVLLVKRGFDWKTGVLAAVAIAGAFLSKMSAIFLPAPLGLAIVFDSASWRSKLVRTAALGSLLLAIVSPWLWHNLHIYGDPFARTVMYSALGGQVRLKPLSSPYFVANIPVLAASFVGLFGWMNLLLPKWVYALYFLLLAFGAWSWAEGFLRRRIDRKLSLLLLSIVALNLMIVLELNVDFDQPQGRYMFPALPAIALLLAMGLESLPFWSSKVSRLVAAGWAAANLIILVCVVIPAYWPAPR